MTDAPVYCIHCGATIPVDAAFCPTCGKPQSAITGTSPAAGIGSPEAPRAATGVGRPVVAVTKPTSKAPTLIALVVAGVALGAFLWLQQSSVSDAAVLWCTDHDRVAVEEGRRLGVFPPDNLLLTVDGFKVPVQGVSQLDLDKMLAAADSPLSDWRTADAAGFARACNAAFAAR